MTKIIIFSNSTKLNINKFYKPISIKLFFRNLYDNLMGKVKCNNFLSILNEQPLTLIVTIQINLK